VYNLVVIVGTDVRRHVSPVLGLVTLDKGLRYCMLVTGNLTQMKCNNIKRSIVKLFLFLSLI
jgi:hypothetical protein